MLTDEQLAMRKTMVTASDTYVLAGEGYSNQSPLQVWREKTGDVAPWEGTTYTRIGNLLEPLLFELLAEEIGLTMIDGVTERDPLRPWLGATPDRLVLDSDKTCTAVAEGKVVLSPSSAKKWKELPPDRVIIQGTIQMIVKRVRKLYVPALLLGEFRYWEIELDSQNLGPALLDMDQQFWEGHVVTGIPPLPDASEASARALKELYPRVKGGLIRASADVEDAAREYFQARKALEPLLAAESAAENKLKAAIGEHAGIEGDGWRAAWGERKGSVSWKKAADELLKGTPAEVFEQFRGAPSRVFDCKPTTK